MQQKKPDLIKSQQQKFTKQNNNDAIKLNYPLRQWYVAKINGLDHKKHEWFSLSDRKFGETNY